MRHLGGLPTSTGGGIWDSGQETAGATVNGIWRRLPDGFIQQSGTATLVNGAVSVVFPLAFPTACRFFSVTPLFSGAANGQTSIGLWPTTAPTKTGVQVTGRVSTFSLAGLVTLGSNSFSFMWQALGD